MATGDRSKHSSQETSIIVALMDQVEGLRSDIAKQTETISNKIDAQSKESRSEFKELRDDISEIKSRLASGSEQIRTLRKDVDAQGERCAVHGTTALEKRASPQPTTGRKAKATAPAWWVVLIAGGALAWGGERFAKFVINGMADPPPAVAPAPKL
jgi:septal ring factor EnvC (AmiA/AmiB activator)